MAYGSVKKTLIVLSTVLSIAASASGDVGFGAKAYCVEARVRGAYAVVRTLYAKESADTEGSAGKTDISREERAVPLEFDDNGNAFLSLKMPRVRMRERAVSVAVEKDGETSEPVLSGLGNGRFIRQGNAWRVTVFEKDVFPEEDVAVKIPGVPDSLETVVDAGAERMFSVSVKVPEIYRPLSLLPLTWRILWDSSASRTKKGIAEARAAIEVLPENACYELMEFSNMPARPFVCATRSELLERIDRVVYDGGTDFASLSAAHRDILTENRTLLFTDGVDTFCSGEIDFGMVKPLVFISGNSRCSARLRRACGGRVIDAATVKPEDVFRFVSSPPPFVEEIYGDGVKDVLAYCSPVSGRMTVVGRLVSDSAEIVMDFGKGRRTAPVQLSAKDVTDNKAVAALLEKLQRESLPSVKDDESREYLDEMRRGIEKGEWNGYAPYLNKIKNVKVKLGPSVHAAYREYLVQREGYGIAESFYVDCAGWFRSQNEHTYAERILSNVAELKYGGR